MTRRCTAAFTVVATNRRSHRNLFLTAQHRFRKSQTLADAQIRSALRPGSSLTPPARRSAKIAKNVRKQVLKVREDVDP
jgi:hypothetical protein